MKKQFSRFRILLLATLCLQIILALPAAADDQNFSAKWRSISASDQSESTWINGSFANLGFTEDQLKFQVTPKDNSSVVRYLVMSPVYLDHLDVTLVSKLATEQIFLGDTQAQRYNDAVIRLPGKIAVRLPADILHVEILARSTSNLRLTIELHDEQQLQQQLGQTTFGAALLLTLITISWIAALVTWSLNRSKSLLYFAAYQLSWTLLLSGIFYPVIQPNLWTIQTNNYLVSFGAILATFAGSLTHAQILAEFAAARIAAIALRVVALMSAALMSVFISGYELLALELNILLISIVPLLIIFIIIFIKPQETRRVIWRRIQTGYILLMGSVVLTGISGLGIGNLFDITYIHALITTLLLSLILIFGIPDRTKQIRHQLQTMELEAAQKALIETQLNENIAMFEMLSHEIKTPLTTLSMMLHQSTNRERAGRQIDAIRTIIEQTGVALNLSNSAIETSRISLQKAIMGNWQLLSSQSEGRSLDVKLTKDFWLEADSYLLDILLRNVLKNAIKYGATATPIRVYTLMKERQLVIIISNVSRIAYLDSSNLFKKYWRSEESKSVRGSGLGLWLVKRISDISNFDVAAVVKRNRFRIILTINAYGEIE